MKYAVFTLTILFNTVLYSMEAGSGDVDAVAKKLNETLSLNSYPKTWFSSYPDESPFSLLGIDPGASKQELVEALSKIKEESSDAKIKLAKAILTTNAELLNLDANSKFTDITGTWRSAKSPENKLAAINTAFKMMDLYCIYPEYSCSFFEEANDSLKIWAQRASSENQLVPLIQIVDRQIAFCNKIKVLDAQKDISKFERSLTDISSILCERFQVIYN